MALLDSVEWAHSFDRLNHSIAHRFARCEPREHTAAYLRGLLGPVERKNAWQVAEAVGRPDPYALQHLINRAKWNPHAVRDDLRAYVIEHLGADDAVLVVDETGFLKKGNQSVGVARQYSGTAGRTENCQIGVFLTYASTKGHTFIDRELYLPSSWTAERERCRAVGVPEEVGFATKLQLARQMLLRTHEAGVPARWVTADALYGSDHRFRRAIEECGWQYMLAVKSDQSVWIGRSQHGVRTLLKEVEPSGWQVLSCGGGSKGERLYRWATVELEHPDGEHLRRWAVGRQNLAQPDKVVYYLASAPAGTPLTELVRVAGLRWTVEQCFQSAKGEVGLDHYEVRTWQGWYRQITCRCWPMHS